MRPKNTNREPVGTPTGGAVRPQLTSNDAQRAGEPRTTWHRYQGQRVSIALADGTLINDGLLISAGRRRVQTLWVFTEDADMFIPQANVAEMWLASGRVRNHAA
jgi:hypothetical protein